MSQTTTRSTAGNEVWWNIRQVAEFLGVKPNTARVWMWKNNVRRSKANYRLTHKSWVEAALNARAKKVSRGTGFVPLDELSSQDDSTQTTTEGTQHHEPTPA